MRGPFLSYSMIVSRQSNANGENLERMRESVRQKTARPPFSKAALFFLLDFSYSFSCM